MDDAHEVTLSVRDWKLIDGTIDNSVALAAVDGDDERSGSGTRVRQAGWAAARSHPDVAAGSMGWPLDGASLTVRLPAADWSFVLAEIARWAEVEERLGDVEERDESLRLAQLLRTNLADG
ncbi:hypothetical protein [Cellulomonas sp.]|uniref:hypothetical protein n=1 Tax=Cellulomonas sp. TaxID=40001 RepID=UPI001B069889|nr:hypothetical protein [Cellulomonas sp.]MBO9555982.1 hypothetical protein [Cellulomonas sp.]